MAVILRPEFEAPWLDPSLDDPSKLVSMLQPYPAGDMEMYPVSPSVNSPAFDEPHCITPFGETREQLSLL